MALSRWKRLGDLLIEAGVITPLQLESALVLQKTKGCRLGHALLELGHIEEPQLLHVLEAQLGTPSVQLSQFTPEREALDAVPLAFLQRNKLFPLAVTATKLRVATADPLDIDALDALRGLARREIEVAVASERDIDEALAKWYAPQSAAVFPPERGEEVQTVQLTESILTEAVRARASDVHIEPQDGDLRIRFRVDGVLQDFRRLPSRHAAGAISRLKALAQMDITERRLPQDGQLRTVVDGRETEFRVSTLPTRIGEKMVLRLFERDRSLLALERLGFTQRNLALFREGLRGAHGIVLVTGPTGSGKTTTLYAALNEFSHAERNIVTVEDPIEYSLPDIVQTAVNTRAGYTFATALRSIFRQDPDVIMVGEMRDAETARIAVQAALTGHLVLSTLHTNDAPSTLARLVDMGIEPFLVASVARCILAQRLVRTNCPGCTCWDEVPLSRLPLALQERAARASGGEAKSLRLARGRGCARCGGRGYLGRTALHEVMLITEELASLIARGVSARQIREAAGTSLVSLLDDGIAKALEGITTLEEVYRVAL